MIKIAIASDHHGYLMKQKIIEHLAKKNYVVIDLGPDSAESVDYPIFAKKVAESIVNKKANKGIVICYTGIGVSIACNRIKGIRCARVVDRADCKHARQDNDANVIAISSELKMHKVYNIIDTFLNTKFSNLERHKRRITEIDD